MTRPCPAGTDTPASVAPSSGPLPRPTLIPGLRRLWRDRHRLQLGTDPAKAVVLELPDPAAAGLLSLLDGSRSERTALAVAARHRISPQDAHALLTTLRRAGLVVAAHTLLPQRLPDRVRRRLTPEAAALALRGDNRTTPAQSLRRRLAARVMVAGSGALVAPIAIALAQAGVGHVWVPEQPAAAAGAGAGAGSEGRAGTAARAAAEIVETIGQTAPGTRTTPLRRRETSFVVQVGAGAPANLAAAGYARHRLPHLTVTVRDGTAVVGPLVPPTGAPCLNCVDLHRRDRDPEWPALAAQLARPGDDPCAVATTLTAAGLATAEVLSWLDGDRPATLGASLEVSTPGQVRRRRWPPHPQCACFTRRRPARARH